MLAEIDLLKKKKIINNVHFDLGRKAVSKSS